MVSGFGINDYEGVISDNGKELKSYQTWRNIIARCYCDNTRKRYRTYSSCEVSCEWRYFSNFKKWFDENYIEGYDMDKDLISPNNHLYSAETCVFIPHRLNTLFRKLGRVKECSMAGVAYYKKGVNKSYRAVFRANGGTKCIGGLKTEEDAHKLYVDAKKQEVYRLANEYYSKGQIDEKVYNLVLNYIII